MKILYLHDRPSGGAGQSLYYMVSDAKEWESIVCFSSSGFLKSKFKKIENSVPQFYFQIPSWLYSRKNSLVYYFLTQLYLLPRRIQFIRRLYKIVKQFDVDIIHSNSITNIEGGIVAKILGLKHVIQIRELLDLDYYQYPISKKVLLRILLFFSDRLIANSNRTAQALMRLGVQEANIDVIYNIVNPSEEQEDIRSLLGYSKSIKVVAIVGWITPNKKIEDFIEVAKQFEADETIKFVLIGGWGGKENYNNKIKELLNTVSNIKITGVLESAEKYMASLDILLCPCYTESFGRTVGEALVNGTPAIGINSCAVSEIIDHEKSGYLVKEGDINAMGEYTSKLLNEHQLNRKFGEYGVQKARETFSKKIILKQFHLLYKSLV